MGAMDEDDRVISPQVDAGEEAGVTADGPDGGEGDGPARPKRRRKRNLAVALGVVAVIVVAAGIGFGAWHEQPSFCNAICHSPMDSYVEGYYSGDENLLVTTHARAGRECLDCHVSSIDQQVAEATAWASGDFKDPISPGLEYEDSFCLNESCHNLTREELASSTDDLSFNPHLNRHGDIACSTCHKMHGESTMYCASCHEEAQELADEIGWDYTKTG